MKTIRFLLSSSMLCLLLFSCSKDNDSNVVSDFPFTVSESHPEMTFVNTPQETSFKILPEKEVSSNAYTFRYEVISGSGSFLDLDSNVVPKKTDVELSSLTPSYFFNSSEVGEVTVRVTIGNGSGTEESIQVVYDVRHYPFSVELSAPFSEAKVQSKIPVTLSLFNEGGDGTITYERAFFITQGSGSVKIPGSDQNLALDSYEEIEEGTLNVDLTFNDLGEAKLRVIVRDSNGQELVMELTFSIQEIDVSYSANISEVESFLGSDNQVFFSLIENQGSGGSYAIKYIINSGNAGLYNNGQAINPGVFVNVNPGAFSWDAVALEAGEIDISLILRNQNGAEISENIEFIGVPNELVLEHELGSDSILVNETMEISLLFSSSQGEGGDYEMSYTVNSGFVNLSLNNAILVPNSWVDIGTGNMTIEALGLNDGPVEINFTIRDEFGTETSRVVNFSVENPDFSFIAQFDQEAEYCDWFLCEPVPVSLSITPLSGTQTFEMSITNLEGDYYITDSAPIEGDQLLTIYNSQQTMEQLNILPFFEPFEISPGGKELLVVDNDDINDDVLRIRFTVTNNYGIEKEQVIEIDFK